MKINLQDPWQARRWLKLLVADERCGFRLRPNLSVTARELGFSFRSNGIGLHGPCDGTAGSVVFGTSYAMGIAVNEGENWHDLCLPQQGWLNLGLAVGVTEWQELLNMHHRGVRGTAVLLYHPNIWVHCQMYGRWKASGRDVFSVLRWHTGWLRCCWLAGRKAVAYRRGLRNGRWLEVTSGDGAIHSIDTDYAAIAEADIAALVAEHLPKVAALLAGFDRVVVVRLQVKQELVPESLRTSRLRRLCQQYDDLWDQTIAGLGRVRPIEFHRPAGFDLTHFRERDSHWNARGNKLFAHWFRAVVMKDGDNPGPGSPASVRPGNTC